MVKRRRSLPPVSPRIDREMKPLISAMTEILEVGEGVRGDPRDRKLTIGDLVDLGLARARSGAGRINLDNLEASLPELAQPDMATPPSPSGLGVSGGFNGLISLVWDIPGTLYGNHAYTNIYRAEEDNFANAVKVGAEAGAFFTDNVRADAEPKTYYYWITFVSTADVEGPTNATAGTAGQALQDVAYLLETLTNNLNDAPATLGAPDETLILHADRFALRTGPADDPVYPMVVQDINGTPTVVLDTAIIRDGAIQEGKLGPVTFGKLVASDGVTPITTVGGLLKADYIDADNLSVAEAATFTGIAKSTNFATGLSGWRLTPAGAFEANNATFRGHVEMDTGYIADSVQIGGLGGLAYKESLAYTEVTGTKPPTDADNTATHTAYDTARVSGSAASSVLTWAKNGNSAKGLTDHWVKPGFTWIDGNKIYTGDAYVDTLQIKGNAISANIAKERYSSFSPTYSQNWNTYTSVGYTSPDPSATIPCVFFWQAAAGHTESWIDVQIRVYRGSSTLFQTTLSKTVNYRQFNENYSVPSSGSHSGFGWFVANIPPGFGTIYVQFRATESNGNVYIHRATLVIMGAAR
jgi:hypothetical protein